jgi:uncharacterized membrane protein YphA (DoxX/SURF4 family)
MVLRYPDGSTGLALLVLRSSCASGAFPALAYLCPASGGSNAATAVSGLIALSLVAGLGTRIAALLLIVVIAADLLTVNGRLIQLLLALAGGAGAVVLLGAGAYSLDARRHGRRVIRLELRSPDQGNQH